MGTQISWLLPAALVAIAALVWATWRRPRTDPLRASVLVWGGWLLVTGIVFSFASGIIHPYYTVALAPAIAALVGLGVVELWRRRADADGVARWTLAALVGLSAWWTYVLLGRASWHPELRWIVVVAGVLAVGLVLAGTRVRAWLVAPVLAVTLLVAPTAYAVQTASTAHTGALPTAGPASGGGFGGFGGGRPGGGAGRPTSAARGRSRAPRTAVPRRAADRLQAGRPALPAAPAPRPAASVAGPVVEAAAWAVSAVRPR